MLDMRFLVRPAGAVGVCLGWLALGCAPSLSSFEPAHVPAKGHLQAEVGADISVPTGTLARSIDAAKTLASAAKTRSLTEDEKIQLLGAGLNIALNPPAFVQHLGVAYVPAAHWQVGLRYASGGWRLGARRQLFGQADRGLDATLGVGIQRYSFGFPVDEILDVVEIDDFTRWNADLSLVLGKKSAFHRIWGGPRLVFSSFDGRVTVRAPGAAGTVASEDVAAVSGSGSYLVLQGGVAVGYELLFVGFELSVARMFGSANMDVFARRVDTGTDTWVIYPGLAILGEF